MRHSYQHSSYKISTFYTEGLASDIPLMRRDIAMNQKEAQLFVEAAYKRKSIGSKSAIKDWLFCLLAIHTGMRISEVGNLTIRCLVLDNPTPYIFIRQGKTTRSVRCVVLNSKLLSIIDEYRRHKLSWKEKWEGTEPLLRSPMGNKVHYTRYGLYCSFKRVLALAFDIKSKERFHPHSLRHTFATILGEVTSSMTAHEPNYPMIRDLLGHSSVETTIRYMKSFSPKIIEALEEYGKVIHPKKLPN